MSKQKQLPVNKICPSCGKKFDKPYSKQHICQECREEDQLLSEIMWRGGGNL